MKTNEKCSMCGKSNVVHYGDICDSCVKHSFDFKVTTKQFRNTKTGEIVTQVPLLDIRDYEEVKL